MVFIAASMAAMSMASTLMANAGLGAGFDSFVEDRQRQTDIEIQNLASSDARAKGRIISQFVSSGGAATSGTARDLVNTQIFQTNRSQVELEQQEAADLSAAATETSNQMESPLINAASSFFSAGGTDIFAGGETTSELFTNVGPGQAFGDQGIPLRPTGSGIGGF